MLLRVRQLSGGSSSEENAAAPRWPDATASRRVLAGIATSWEIATPRLREAYGDRRGTTWVKPLPHQSLAGIIKRRAEATAIFCAGSCSTAATTPPGSAQLPL